MTGSGVRVAIACSGLGHVQRGIEAWASDTARGLQRAGIAADLFGGGPGPGITALANLPRTALTRELVGAAAQGRIGGTGVDPFEVVIHRRYNPEGLTAYNIVPGLLGVILTMTMVLMTSLAVTRETERGTMENLLAMPLRPAEVMAGKILPYIVIGYVQVGVVLLAARHLFGVPMLGSIRSEEHTSELQSH